MTVIRPGSLDPKAQSPPTVSPKAPTHAAAFALALQVAKSKGSASPQEAVLARTDPAPVPTAARDANAGAKPEEHAPDTPAREAPNEPHRKLDEDPLDPATRQAAQLAPPSLPPAPVIAPPDAGQVRARASLEEVLAALVKRVAWSGDGRRGVLRLEFGAGSLAGGTLVVHADDGRVRVELAAPAGANPVEWKERITARLLRRGLSLEDVRVD